MHDVMDVVAVFGMLFVLMFLPVLLFKTALTSKVDTDQLDASNINPCPECGRDDCSHIDQVRDSLSAYDYRMRTIPSSEHQ